MSKLQVNFNESLPDKSVQYFRTGNSRERPSDRRDMACTRIRKPKVNFINVFTRSFYARRSQKRKKDSQVKQLFALLGPACVKAACKLVFGNLKKRKENLKNNKKLSKASLKLI